MATFFRKTFVGLCLLALVSCQGQEFGMASYYDSNLDGRVTAYGDVYKKGERTAASNTHPYGTMLRVTRLDNDRSVIVKVIDKGPYVEGRIIDLSYAAARQLDMIDEGVVKVKVEVHAYSEEESPLSLSRMQDPQRLESRLANTSPAGEPTAESTLTRAPGPVNATPRSPAGGPLAPPQQSDSKYGLYRVRLDRTPSRGFGVQVQVITDYAMVIKRIADLQAQHFDDGILLSVEPGPDKPLYKLLLGPFDTREQAETYQANLKSRYDITGFVVDFREKSYADPGNGR